MILQIVILIGLSILILRRPYLGIAITLASLPLTDILPDISWAGSVVSLLGGITLVSFLLSQLLLKRAAAQGRPKMTATLVMGFLFVVWMIASNVSAAITPESDGRIWAVTFIQLWVFAWMAASLFDTVEKVDILMWIFCIAAFVSAVYASFQGIIGLDIHTSVRAIGLAEGANGAARYFLIALMFSLFLFSKQRNKILKIVLIGAIATLLYGVLLTISRTGLLLVVGGIGLFIMQNFQSKAIIRSVFVILLALLVVWLFAENIVSIFSGIVPSILKGGDTVGVRYGLWQAGLRMWLDYPISGVGIGHFTEKLPQYAWDLLPTRYLGLDPHNMYIAVLSETGIIGFLIFLIMFVMVLRDMLKAMRSKNVDISVLAKNWLIVVILVLLAGITKQDYYHKLNWILIGIGASIYRIGESEQNVQID